MSAAFLSSASSTMRRARSSAARSPVVAAGVSRCGRPSALGTRGSAATVPGSAGSVTIDPSSGVRCRAHGRRYTRRPHPGRGSAATVRPRRGPGSRTPRDASADRPARRSGARSRARAGRSRRGPRPGSRRAARRRAGRATAREPARARSPGRRSPRPTRSARGRPTAPPPAAARAAAPSVSAV